MKLKFKNEEEIKTFDFFAGLAMQAILIKGDSGFGKMEEKNNKIAQYAFIDAEIMLKERRKYIFDHTTETN